MTIKLSLNTFFIFIHFRIFFKFDLFERDRYNLQLVPSDMFCILMFYEPIKIEVLTQIELIVFILVKSS